MFKKYRRIQIAEMYPWEEGFSIEGIFISVADFKNGSPKVGDMIARNPKDHKDLWLIAKDYAMANFEKIEE